MQTFSIPSTDISSSRIGFGTWAIAGGFNWGPQDEQDSINALKEAYHQGITFFDTAEGYGNGKSERLVSNALAPYRKNVIIATKVSPNRFSYELLKEACHERLEALNMDYIDLLQLHWPNHEVAISESLAALADLKQEGKIRAYGVSNFGKIDLTEALSIDSAISTNQLPYNLLWRAIEYDIVPLCEQYKLPILAYMPIMQGMLAGKYNSAAEVPEDRARTRHFSHHRSLTRHSEDGCETETFEVVRRIKQLSERLEISMAQLSISWLLSKEVVGSVLVGARNPEQVKRNIKAAQISLTQDVINELEQMTNPLKEKLGNNPDMWQSESRYR